MLIGYSDTTPSSTPTSTTMRPESLPEGIERLVLVVGQEEKSVKEMMEAIGLKDRKNFMEYSLMPALTEGLVRMKFPDSPRHPRQKYRLTERGLAVYNEVNRKAQYKA